MKKIILFLSLIHFCVSYCQISKINASVVKVKFVEVDDFIGEDALGFSYYIKDSNFIKLKNSENWQYTNIALGKIKRVDIQNPLKIVIFYENFNCVVILDNQLNEIKNINFSLENQEISASAIGISSQGNLWVFNSITMQLGLYNYESEVYKKIGLPFDKKIKSYSSNFNTFYWIDENNNFYSCDIFGKVNLLAQIPTYDSIYIADENTIVFGNQNVLYLMEVSKNKIYEIEISEKTFKNFQYKDQNLSIFTPKGITNYKINIP
ncbi:hypothetical protein [Flavobacterium sp.]|uniref:hypothetical protein n=1 Tax=Flavobacterium sp. TaxID=239 RepID=UPI00286D5437|nr:hypothetical protein [Flavobacterium sp.]